MLKDKDYENLFKNTFNSTKKSNRSNWYRFQQGIVFKEDPITEPTVGATEETTSPDSKAKLRTIEKFQF